MEALKVVDGHQRLQSVFGFLRVVTASNPRHSFVPTSFRALRLKGLQVRTDLNGQGIEDLDSVDHERLLERRITAMVIPKSNPPGLRFVLFERLNLGTVPLNPQELRNCIFRGPYNDLINGIASESDVLALLSMKKPHKRMHDRELVLRFFALLHRRGMYRSPFNVFLDEEMQDNQHADASQLQGFRYEFSQARRWMQRVFKQEVCQLFRRGNQESVRGRWDRWTQLIYEIEMVGFAEYGSLLEGALSNVIMEEDHFLSGLRSELIEVMCGDSFLDTLREGTRREHNMEKRFALWTSRLEKAVRFPEEICRVGSDVARTLRSNATCHQCLTPIDSIDDAHKVDLGSEIRVAHRHCFRVWVARNN